jgi:hypothetical protein
MPENENNTPHSLPDGREEISRLSTYTAEELNRNLLPTEPNQDGGLVAPVISITDAKSHQGQETHLHPSVAPDHYSNEATVLRAKIIDVKSYRESTMKQPADLQQRKTAVLKRLQEKGGPTRVHAEYNERITDQVTDKVIKIFGWLAITKYPKDDPRRLGPIKKHIKGRY